jgi:hypothetical protein
MCQNITTHDKQYYRITKIDVIAELDPAIHPFARKADARVKPVGDA